MLRQEMHLVKRGGTMTRSHFVKKARKAYKEFGIKKGESYYWWKFRRGGMHKSKIAPKPSQLTQSEFWSTVYSIQENYDKTPDSKEDIESQVDEIKSELEQCKDETQEKLDNMPEGLQQGDTGQLLEERVSSLDECISELEGIDLEDGTTEEIWEQVIETLSNISCS
jgi:hypothetical protein